jgi:predicted neutral ceramidase superfamily lipid hydrolase
MGLEYVGRVVDDWGSLIMDKSKFSKHIIIKIIQLTVFALPWKRYCIRLFQSSIVCLYIMYMTSILNTITFSWKSENSQLYNFNYYTQFLLWLNLCKFLSLKQNPSIPTSCTIRHISLIPWCVGSDIFHCINTVNAAYK